MIFRKRAAPLTPIPEPPSGLSTFRVQVGAITVEGLAREDCGSAVEVILGAVSMADPKDLVDGLRYSHGSWYFNLHQTARKSFRVSAVDLSGPGLEFSTWDLSYAATLLAVQSTWSKSVSETAWSPVKLGQTLRVSPSALDMPRVTLRREEPTEPNDSGWVVGPGAAADQEVLPVHDVIRRRGNLARALTLPVGARVETAGKKLVSIYAASDRFCWGVRDGLIGMEIPTPKSLARRWAVVSAVKTALGYGDSCNGSQNHMYHDDGGGNWVAMDVLDDQRALLYGHDHEASENVLSGTGGDSDVEMNLLAKTPDWWNAGLPREGVPIGFVFGFEGGSWARAEYDHADGFLSVGFPMKSDEALAEEIVDWIGDASRRSGTRHIPAPADLTAAISEGANITVEVLGAICGPGIGDLEAGVAAARNFLEPKNSSAD